ncbi:MAG: hypothetical protein A2Z91_03155 [Deltaproteobacteria bacterium GWA2_38_16]|nr:MAG: hypothetical protein A2Z91_03155 [Deltaproteobacteria bacterium GWA2_38_16]OGQ02883.1 MAG: hypothetical protein A3D19_06580 [Deltaproteobacteria bacterium RIFCSPHIGHO2_02_FULL_38_15]OGQ35101.1 MAG: hypothetical protein A3A72_03600 [Deltaproteobacteria bacterium RIFCSPLOWO2_01_FULL_38_9]OGQ63439.1 MAG: hypothetical protein A3G92_07105 [Deltaproteobacteria bacterium RIFCSPLOWO2_12_FULL_38_8]HBQ21730.1 DUF192 domain-containing protein [Deltaproteobacteria bacterium]
MSILKNNTLLTQKDTHAQTFYARFKGLLGKNSFTSGEALILTPCKSIHTFFMKFPIDAIFINAQGEILALYPDLKPNRLTKFYCHAKSVIEVPIGTIQKWNLKVGESLCIN